MSELYHYGVKGMKWGVRRYQKKDGSLTSTGKRRYSYRDLSDDNLESTKKLKAHWDKYNDEIKKFDQDNRLKDNEWLDSNGRLSEKARKYMSKSESIYNRYNKASRKLEEARSAERKAATKSILSDEKVKKDVDLLRDVSKKLDKLKDDYLGYKSKAYQDAFEDYKKKHGDDDGYGFHHYEWQEGNASYDKAYSEYESISKQLISQRDTLRKNIGKTVTEGYSDVKIKGMNITYSEDAEHWVMQHILFDH